MSLLLFAALLSAPAPPSVVVVIDGKSRQPVAGVNVRDPAALPWVQPLVTDNAGRFEYAGPRLRVQLSRLGYEETAVDRPLKTGSAPDTVLLMPRAVSLEEVTVHPGKRQVLASAAAEGKKVTRLLLPGQTVAVEILPAAAEAGTQQLETIRFFLTQKAKQGRVRVQLVPAVKTPEGRQPGTNNLLVEPVLVSYEQLRNAPKGCVTLDLRPLNLTLPADGMYVVLEGLATTPGDVFIGVNRPTRASEEFTINIGPDPLTPEKSQAISPDDFPGLEGRQAAGAGIWSKVSPTASWKRGSSTNVHVELEVLADGNR